MFSDPCFSGVSFKHIPVQGGTQPWVCSDPVALTALLVLQEEVTSPEELGEAPSPPQFVNKSCLKYLKCRAENDQNGFLKQAGFFSCILLFFTAHKRLKQFYLRALS